MSVTMSDACVVAVLSQNPTSSDWDDSSCRPPMVPSSVAITWLWDSMFRGHNFSRHPVCDCGLQVAAKSHFLYLVEWLGHELAIFGSGFSSSWLVLFRGISCTMRVQFNLNLLLS